MFERFTAGARQVVTLAGQEARQLGHRYIGTEHLLLAMLDESSGGAAAVLHGAGVAREHVRDEVTRLLQAGPYAGLGESDAEALRSIGIDLPAVRAKIEEVFGAGALDAVHAPPPRRGLLRWSAATWPPGGGRPFSARAKKVLELSLRECIHIGHKEIRSEHILLGLLREGQGLAVKVLVGSDVDLDSLRRRTLAAVADRAA